MLRIIVIFLFSIVSLGTHSGEKMLNSLADLRWENRIIIVFTNDNGQREVDALKKEVANIDDRDIIWFLVNTDDTITNYHGTISPTFRELIVKKYQSNPNQTILIGKDGGVKERLTAIDLKYLFSKIDAMPMRIQEMRDK